MIAHAKVVKYVDHPTKPLPISIASLNAVIKHGTHLITNVSEDDRRIRCTCIREALLMSLKAFFVKFNLRAVESSHGLYHDVKAERHMVQLFINHFVKFLHR